MGTIAPPLLAAPSFGSRTNLETKVLFFSEEVATKVFVRKKLLLTGNQLEARCVH